PEVDIYYFENILEKDDFILLCSDGLYTIMSKDRLSKGLGLGAHSLVKKASSLMEDNLPDDTTAIVLEVLNADEKELLKRQNVPIPKSLKAGQNIDGYILEKSLIQNDRTWIAFKKTKRYVLKFAPIEAIDDETILDLFVKEAWNAKRLKADFFAKAVIPKNRTARYYVMELFDGEDLGKYLKTQQLSIDDGVKLAQTLLKMSQFLLKYDLVHGDIKPENIMLCKDEKRHFEFKIIDFGSITEIFSTHSKAGTPSFLSPERFVNEAISETSEIFAIGVTLYLALTGKYPYGEIEPFQNPAFKEAKKPSTYNKNIPDWLDSVILRSIAIDKEQRYAYYSEMAYELSNPQKVKPFFAKGATLIERSPLAFYRTGFILMTVLSMALLLLIGYQNS
ncbi:protein kinase, partial [bacterium]|nr:protein kinase [bacterium]